MATVSISFTDNATNESSFRVYRSTSATVAKSDEYIAEISLSGGTWSISGQSGSDHTLTSTNTGDSTTTGETFTFTYTENTSGTFYYGVCAHNNVGDSAVANSSSSIVVA